MEVDECQTQVCKLSRIGNSRNDSNNKIGRRGGHEQYQDEDEDDGDGRTGGGGGGGVAGGVRAGISGGGGFDIVSNDSSRLRAWHSSRIFRVSRASGGKDRHSKVLTAKGLRDRRVRLSVSTAIQFYDLQDRLGYDQPSKAVEWLIKAAADAISELPSLNTTFPDTPKQLSDEKRPSNNNNNASEPRFDMAEMELEAEPYQHQQHHNTLSKSASSTSETSKGSGLSLSRSEIRVKARERARERTAKDKEKDKQDDQPVSTQQNAHHSSSFTDLLTGGPNNHSPSASAAQQNPSFSSFILKQQPRQVASTPMDHYFTSGLFGSGSSLRNHYPPSGYSGQAAQYGNAPAHHTMTAPSPYNVSTEDHHHQHHHHHQELHQFSFLPEHMIPDASTAPGSDYDLNFTISSGMSGYNRGTLQSNSSQSPLPHHLQRFPSPAEGPNMPFFMGNVAAAAAAASAAPPTENHYSSAGGFDGRLQLYYGDGDDRHSDLKGKGKN